MKGRKYPTSLKINSLSFGDGGAPVCRLAAAKHLFVGDYAAARAIWKITNDNKNGKRSPVIYRRICQTQCASPSQRSRFLFILYCVKVERAVFTSIHSRIRLRKTTTPIGNIIIANFFFFFPLDRKYPPSLFSPLPTTL